MRLSKIKLQNIKSFLYLTEIDFSASINIFIGPNGGGKSNLMNTLSWLLNSRFYRPFNYQLQNNEVQLQLHNVADQQPEAHWSSPNSPSFIWIEFEITKEDLEGMRECWRKRDLLKEDLENVKWAENSLFGKDQFIADVVEGIVDPDRFGVKPGKKIRYKITINRNPRRSVDLAPLDDNDDVIAQDEDCAELYNSYLAYLTDAELRRTLPSGGEKISLPYILYSPSRQPHDLSINLSSGANISEITRNFHNEMQAHALNNQGPSQILTQIASFVIGAEFVQLIYTQGLASAEKEFSLKQNYKDINKALEVFGFKWKLKVVNPWSNIFQINISKKHEENYFAIPQASSGERQLLNFIFGLTSSAIENSLIIIDEPELNLHPRWQKLLLKFFLDVQSTKKSQLLMSTHSASFLSAETLPHVRRIFRDSQSSALSESHSANGASEALLEAVKLLNAQHNERIFFTQKAVLVEGSSDFIIWQKLINTVLEILGVGDTIEVIEVSGSANFVKYRTFLGMFQIDSFIVADLDYVMLIGDDEIKSIFKRFFQENKACQSLLVRHSLDRSRLISSLDKAIEASNFEEVKTILEYLKCRNANIVPQNLSKEEALSFETFRSEKQKEHIYVLEKGSLESYYLAPDQDAGAIQKDTDKAIAFASNDAAFKSWICNGARFICGERLTVNDEIMAAESAEFIRIALSIIGLPASTTHAQTLKKATYQFL